ncbi:helix-turn-helix domain-containing protein [Streptomyces sp. NPDC089919]|uniref:helix-turn-helix domain-containing protein n=1 Tax=Streptomyces sp. NPDC089919 TaxID=3155188 RepID=UPI00342BB5D9
MRIHLTARRRAFTVLGNDVLRDRRLSFTARGILCYLLSLPDGAHEDARTLADKNPGLGRRGVAKALDELVALGYYLRRTTRDPETGQVRTDTSVSDTPHSHASPAPVPARPGTGEPCGGKAGRSPEGVENPGEEPSRPEPDGPPPPPVPGVAEAAPPGRAAALLAGLAAVEPRLALSAADVLALAPAADRWLARGTTEAQARTLLTAGLPAVVHSSRALLADRLSRKLPPPRESVPAPARSTALGECARCRDPLPRGQRTGHCATCQGTPSAAPAPALAPGAVNRFAAVVRQAMRGPLPQ